MYTALILRVIIFHPFGRSWNVSYVSTLDMHLPIDTRDIDTILHRNMSILLELIGKKEILHQDTDGGIREEKIQL